jgi:hypothetical protein
MTPEEKKSMEIGVYEKILPKHERFSKGKKALEKP